MILAKRWEGKVSILVGNWIIVIQKIQQREKKKQVWSPHSGNTKSATNGSTACSHVQSIIKPGVQELKVCEKEIFSCQWFSTTNWTAQERWIRKFSLLTLSYRTLRKVELVVFILEILDHDSLSLGIFQ